MKPAWDYLGRKISWQIPASVHIVVEIGIATFVVLIFAEFIPRAIFRARSVSLLSRLSLVTDFFYQMFSPLANGLISLAEWILKYVFNVRVDTMKEPFKRSDLKNLFQQNVDEERQERNTQLLENAQELPKVKIRQCLVPRKEIIGINSNRSDRGSKEKIYRNKTQQAGRI